MEIKIPKVIKLLRLSEYAEEMGDVTLRVWVNPPKATLARFWKTLQDGNKLLEAYQKQEKPLSEAQKSKNEVESDALLDEQLLVMEDLLGQGPEETRLSREDLKRMIVETFETDPVFWSWVRNKTLALIEEHRTLEKKV